jgi:hypothetical protein
MHGFTQEAAETILGISWAFHWHFMGIWGSQVCGSCHFLGRHQHSAKAGHPWSWTSQGV